MKLPNKLISYEDSILSKIPIILKQLEKDNYNLLELYNHLKCEFNSCKEYLETLELLFLLNKIEVLENEEVLKYVN